MTCSQWNRTPGLTCPNEECWHSGYWSWVKGGPYGNVGPHPLMYIRMGNSAVLVVGIAGELQLYVSVLKSFRPKELERLNSVCSELLTHGVDQDNYSLPFENMADTIQASEKPPGHVDTKEQVPSSNTSGQDVTAAAQADDPEEKISASTIMAIFVSSQLKLNSSKMLTIAVHGSLLRRSHILRPRPHQRDLSTSRQYTRRH